MKRLYRTTEGRKLAGVCAGLGEYFNIDPVIFRLAWVAAAFAFGSGLLAYILAILIIPEKSEITRY